MLNHAQALAANLTRAADPRQNFANPYRANLENVMQGTPIQRTKSSILALDQLLQPRPAPIELLQSLLHYLNTYHQNASADEREVFVKIRGGGTEQQNAIRTLMGPLRPGDFSEALTKNTPYDLGPKSLGLGDITALVWHAIDRYSPAGQSTQANANDKNLMRFAVFKALSQCIEDDGHRVCAVGFTQRITTTLQGYYTDVVKIDEDYLLATLATRSTMTPAVFFTEIARRFDQSLPQDQEPSQQELRTFVRDTLHQANAVYGVGAAQVMAVTEMLTQYMGITYGWPSL